MRLRWLLAAVAAVLAAAVIAAVAAPHGSHGRVLSLAAGAPASPGPYICGQTVLDSPWSYDGGATTFTSGQYAGLPTFGSPGTDFPGVTSGVIIPAGNNTAAIAGGSYDGNSTLYYWEPGEHTDQADMNTGNHSVFAGGYTSGAGPAVINGVNGGDSGSGGNSFSYESPSAGRTVDNTWEYLTIENFSSSLGSAVIGAVGGSSPGYGADGDVFKYDTIGPNEYAYNGSGAPILSTVTAAGWGGGYGIYMGNYSTVEYSCLTQNAEGGFAGDVLVSPVVANDEISQNGLGIYPDTDCGCSGGGKFFYSVNADVVNNYVHDNYNNAIWFDFDNTGMVISHNYIASNWGSGIDVEASYNGNIADNDLTGNGWASDGAWPAGTTGDGGAGGQAGCYNSVSCTNGYGPVTGDGGGNPFGAIYLPNTGGNSQLSGIPVPAAVAVPGCSSACTVTSRYSGHFYVQDNVLANNFGGVYVYSSTDRFPGSNYSADSGCSDILGALNQMNNNATYYSQTKVLITNSDTSISGASVTSSGGTQTQCSNYGATSGGEGTFQHVVTAPSAGMGVYDQGTGKYLGNVNTVTSAHAFTLTGSPGSAYTSGDALELSAYGGCGPADYFGGALGATSGTPAADYWDNCIWGSRNVTVTGDSFSLNSGTVTGCTTTVNLCGFTQLKEFNAGVPVLQEFWFSYATHIAEASGGLGDVFSGNAYTWTGTGGWQFYAGQQGGAAVSWATWQGTYGQDAGSTF